VGKRGFFSRVLGGSAGAEPGPGPAGSGAEPAPGDELVVAWSAAYGRLLCAGNDDERSAAREDIRQARKGLKRSLKRAGMSADDAEQQLVRLKPIVELAESELGDGPGASDALRRRLREAKREVIAHLREKGLRTLAARAHVALRFRLLAQARALLDDAGTDVEKNKLAAKFFELADKADECARKAEGDNGHRPAAGGTAPSSTRYSDAEVKRRLAAVIAARETGWKAPAEEPEDIQREPEVAEPVVADAVVEVPVEPESPREPHWSELPENADVVLAFRQRFRSALPDHRDLAERSISEGVVFLSDCTRPTAAQRADMAKRQAALEAKIARDQRDAEAIRRAASEPRPLLRPGYPPAVSITSTEWRRVR